METTIETARTPIKRCAVCKVDLKGRFVYVDDRIESMLGSSMEELFARDFRCFLDEADHEVFNSLLAHHNHFETAFDSAMVQLIAADGSRFAAWIVVSLNFAAGNPVNYQIIINPHTETLPVSEPVYAALDNTDGVRPGGLDDAPGLPTVRTNPEGGILSCEGALWFQECGIGEGSHVSDLTALLARHNDPTTSQQIETFLSAGADVHDEAGIELPVFLPDGSLRRLHMVRECKDDDRQGYAEITFVPARRSGDHLPGGQLDQGLVGSMLSELQKTVTAAVSFSSKLGHEQYNRLDSQGNFQLLCLKNGLDKAATMLDAFSKMVDLAGAVESPEVTDLNLIINQVHQQVSADFPQLTINAKFGDLPKILTCPNLFAPLLKMLIAGMINAGRGGDIDISVAVESNGEDRALNVSFPDIRLPGEFVRRLADFFAEPITAGSRHFPLTGADIHVARYLADRLSVKVSINQSREAGVTVQLALPTHSRLTGENGHEQTCKDNSARIQQVPVAAD